MFRISKPSSTILPAYLIILCSVFRIRTAYEYSITQLKYLIIRKFYKNDFEFGYV